MAEKDESNEFKDYRIKTYDNWDLFLYSKQHPLIGRCYAWAKREDAREVVDMTPDENKEFFSEVLPEWNVAIKRLYNHDRPNVSCLGNDAKHLHWHMVPRYDSTKNFYGIEFNDTDPGRNYVHVKKTALDKKIDLQIRDDISSVIKSL